jgi:hypothetical protein
VSLWDLSAGLRYTARYLKKVRFLKLAGARRGHGKNTLGRFPPRVVTSAG